MGDSGARIWRDACASPPICLSPSLSNMGSLNCDYDGACDSVIEDAMSNDRRELTNRENREALGWKLDAVARGVLGVGAAVFVSTALLKLAKQAAGCTDDQEECENRIYGMKPSSILTNIVLVVGLITALCMPLIGSIIDHTHHRRKVGRISAVALAFLILLQILVMERAWFVAAILQVFIASMYMVHLCAVYAYLPELTTHRKALVNYTAQFVAAQYTASVTFLIFMVGVLSMVGIKKGQEMRSTRLSQGVVVTVCTVAFGFAWKILFQERPPSQKIPEGSTLFTAGFKKLWKTSQTIMKHHSSIKWFLVSAACTEGALTSFSSIAITYMTDQLLFSSQQNGIAILILQISAIPGTRFAAMVTNRYNPIRSLQICLALFMVTTGAASMRLKRGGQEMEAYVFAVLWGFSFGWIYPTEKAMYCTIIPKGQEAELMGIYICACQILSWLPPLLFTLMNESGISMRIGLFSLNIFFFVSFCVLFLVGNYNRAVAHAETFDYEGQMEIMDLEAKNSNADGKLQLDYKKFVADTSSDDSSVPQIKDTSNQ